MDATPTLRPSAARLVAAAAAVALLVWAAGCDSLPANLTLSISNVDLRFTANGSDLSAGSETALQTAGTIDLSDELLDQGFSTSEVLGARVSSARIELVSPAPLELNSLRSVALELRAGSDAVTVATASNLPNDDVASMSVVSGVDVARFIRQPFRAVLRVTPDEVDAGRAYVLEVRVNFSVEVEGV